MAEKEPNPKKDTLRDLIEAHEATLVRLAKAEYMLEQAKLEQNRAYHKLYNFIEESKIE